MCRSENVTLSVLKIIKFCVEWASTENWVYVRKLHRSVICAHNELNEGLKLHIYRKCATQKDVDINRFWEMLSLNLKNWGVSLPWNFILHCFSPTSFSIGVAISLILEIPKIKHQNLEFSHFLQLILATELNLEFKMLIYSAKCNPLNNDYCVIFNLFLSYKKGKNVVFVLF